MKKRILYIFVLFFCLTATSFAQEITMTLDESIAIALRDNRDVLLKTQDVIRAKEKIAESRAGFLPSLTVTSSLTRNDGYYDETTDQNTTQVSAKQYLFKSGKTVNTFEQSKLKKAVSEAILDKTKLDTVTLVKKAFYTLLLAQELNDLNKNIVDNTEKHLASLEARYQNGEASELDILRLKKSLESVRSAFAASSNQMDSVQTLLRNLLYIDEKTKIKLQGEFVYTPKEVAIEEGFLQALERRPEIRQYEAQEKVDKKAIEIIKADNRPAIYASWDYYNRQDINGATSAIPNDYHVMGITVSWPIFDGWATGAKIHQAMEDLKSTQLTREKLLKDIEVELKDAYIALKNAIAQIKTSEADMLVYERNFTFVNEKYSKGIASALDLEDAGLSRDVSFFNKKEAVYLYLLAQSDFDKATGGQ